MAAINLVAGVQYTYTATADCLIQNTSGIDIGYNTDGSNKYATLDPEDGVSILNTSVIYLLSDKTTSIPVVNYNYGA